MNILNSIFRWRLLWFPVEICHRFVEYFMHSKLDDKKEETNTILYLTTLSKEDFFEVAYFLVELRKACKKHPSIANQLDQIMDSDSGMDSLIALVESCGLSKEEIAFLHSGSL